jgi:hypothetical protein
MVGVIIAMAILILGVLVFTSGGFSGLTGEKPEERADGQGETIVGKSLLAGKDTVCRTNIKQVRQSIQIQMDPVDDIYPASLKDLGLGGDFEVCAVGGEAYEYTASTGQVKCPHPGHENY